MAKSYSMYRLFKGEASNPFDHETQNEQHMFWLYESIFERDFQKYDSSDWLALFGDNKLGDRFMKLLSDGDYKRPTDEIKSEVFELWLDYLFTEKLYAEFGGENTFKKAYYSIPAR